MTDMERVIVVAAGAWLLMSGSRTVNLGAQPWMWPLPRLYVGDVTILPEQSDYYWPRATSDHRKHLGSDLCYPTRALPAAHRAAIKARGFPVASSSGAYWCPANVPVLAASAGEVWRVAQTDRGWSVWVVHARGQLEVKYHHLGELARPWKQHDRVDRGTELGTVGDDPKNPRDVRHLHLEVRPWDAASRRFGEPVDPWPLLQKWPRADLRHVVAVGAVA